MDFNHPKKFLVHGVTHKVMHGTPECVIQEEPRSKHKQLEVRGTVKSTVLQGDPDLPNLI